MKNEIIHTLTNNFESYSNQTEDGVEFWLARDLQHLLGYTKWDNFIGVISKAKTACEISGEDINNHFADVGKTIQMPKGAEKEVPDTMLTRYACYLIAQFLQIPIYLSKSKINSWQNLSGRLRHLMFPKALSCSCHQ